MNKLTKILDNCGETIKKIAEFCFLFFIIIAISYLVLGILNILSAINSLNEYYNTFSEIFNEMANYSIYELIFGSSEDFKNLFGGILLCISSLFSVFISFSSLPLYGFGCIVADLKVIKKNTENIVPNNT